MEDHELTIAILNWNCGDVLDRSLSMLFEEIKIYDGNILIVDNGSVDCTKDVCHKHLMVRKNLKVLWNKKNEGISIGKNQCIDMTKSDYLLLLDADIIPVKNSIRCLIEYMKKHTHIDALGFLPQKWSNQENKNGQKHHAEYCHQIVDVQEHHRACMFYGLYRRKVFDAGLRCDESDVFGSVGYGWEDHDFYMTQRKLGFKQYACHINELGGPQSKYYHEINSSVRNMTREVYIKTSESRNKYFKKKWGVNWKTLYRDN